MLRLDVHRLYCYICKYRKYISIGLLSRKWECFPLLPPPPSHHHPTTHKLHSFRSLRPVPITPNTVLVSPSPSHRPLSLQHKSFYCRQSLSVPPNGLPEAVGTLHRSTYVCLCQFLSSSYSFPCNYAERNLQTCCYVCPVRVRTSDRISYCENANEMM